MIVFKVFCHTVSLSMFYREIPEAHHSLRTVEAREYSVERNVTVRNDSLLACLLFVSERESVCRRRALLGAL